MEGTHVRPADTRPAKIKLADIRLAGPSDEAAIRECARLAFGQYSAAIGRDPAPMHADVAAHIAAGEAFVAMASDGTLQGYITLLDRPDALYLDAIAVMPDCTGLGVGRALMAAAEAETRRRGLSRLELCTNQRMTANQTLYPHLGFTETGRGHEDGYDRIFYAKTLA